MSRGLRKWSEKDLPHAVKKAKCWSDVLRNLGLPIAGGSIATVKNRTKILKISTEHFDANEVRRRWGKKNVPALSAKDVLKLNSGHTKKLVRKFAKLYLPYLCKLCDLKDSWNGSPLILQIDHINGDRNDDRLENLRWLCPNCHSQTPTYAGRKI